MSSSARYLNAAEAARRLGISAKTLRIYEDRGLIRPPRTAAGWRAYGPDELARASEIVGLRKLGLGLAQVASVLDGNTTLDAVLAAHRIDVEGRMRELAGTHRQVRAIQSGLAVAAMPAAGERAASRGASSPSAIVLDLPWPWNGERFILPAPGALNYVTGPLGSGKTRLAYALAQAMPGAAFIGLDRLEEDSAAAGKRLAREPELARRVERAIDRMMANGAARSTALLALTTALEARSASMLVIDMVEQGLDRPSQQALALYLRARPDTAPPVFMLTRSNVILDLGRTPPDHLVIHCPANHSPPACVMPYPDAAGYEAVVSCLASPEVRARTAGMVAWLPRLAQADEPPKPAFRSLET